MLKVRTSITNLSNIIVVHVHSDQLDGQLEIDEFWSSIDLSSNLYDN